MVARSASKLQLLHRRPDDHGFDDRKGLVWGLLARAFALLEGEHPRGGHSSEIVQLLRSQVQRVLQLHSHVERLLTGDLGDRWVRISVGVDRIPWRFMEQEPWRVVDLLRVHAR